MTLAAAPEAWQGALSAGLLGMGTVVAGSSEVAGRYLAELVDTARRTGQSFEAVAEARLTADKADGVKTPGIGHPQHTAGDPRANRLLALADEKGASGDYVRMLRAVAQLAPGIYQRPLPINVSGVIPAVILDVGWPVEALKGVPLLARAAGLVAHLYEESQRSIGFIMSHAADKAISYDGEESGKAK
jgi:citrate synthase